MRIRLNWLEPILDSCESTDYGETHDYLVNIVEPATAGYDYENGAWSQSDPSGVATSDDDITVIDGTASLTADTQVRNLTIMAGATLEVNYVLTLGGDITTDGNLVFVSSATGNGELAAVPGTSTITGDVTVQRYMQNKRSYRMVSSPVTTTSSIHDNWQEGASSNADNPNPGFRSEEHTSELQSRP